MKRVLLFPARFTTFLAANNYRVFKVILMILVLITGVYTKEYRGPYQSVINNNVGGLFYVLFGSLFFSFVMGKAKPVWPVVAAFLITCVIEYLQYLQIHLLQSLAHYKLFAYLIGSSFNKADFYYYAAGAVFAFLFLLLMKERKAVKEAESIFPLAEFENQQVEETKQHLFAHTLENSTI